MQINPNTSNAALSLLDEPVATPDAQYRAKAEEAAEKFEGFFISQMLKQMRSSTREMAGDDALFKDKLNADMLDMADGMLADALSSQRAFGVADAILAQLLPPSAPASVNAGGSPVALKKVDHAVPSSDTP